ncbi:MAG: hypothetical protein FWH07_04510 [Oscillospiraceae bacterium]|nr:hypothetical protein [Oscillospiraceae bacterium]
MVKTTRTDFCNVVNEVLVVDIFYTARLIDRTLEKPIKYAVHCGWRDCPMQYRSKDCPLFRDAPKEV